MVAYINKKFSLGLIVVLGIFVVSSYARLSMMVTKGEIDAICKKKGVNSRLCFEVLKPTPEISKLDFSGLAKLLINYEYERVEATVRHLILRADYARSKEYSSKYRKCSNLYEEAYNSLDSSLKALAAKDYDRLNVGVGASITKMNTCAHLLLPIKPSPEDLIAEINVNKDLSDIILVILENLRD